VILSGGENVHPVQVEEVLAEHPQVSDAVVVGLPDERWGQRIVAYVIAHHQPPSVDELDEFCRSHPRLANFKRPRAYRFVSEFPLTATGKKMHFKAAEMAVDDDAAGLLVEPGTAVPGSAPVQSAAVKQAAEGAGAGV
jgi:acyl-CoA synthetase (AMP-forming)/AMP-acid ligase II